MVNTYYCNKNNLMPYETVYYCYRFAAVFFLCLRARKREPLLQA